MLKAKNIYIAPLGLLSSAVLIGALLISSFVSATDNTDVVDEINITVPVSCTLSGTNLLHSATIRNEQYKEDIGSANIKTTCNDTSGYAIYAIGYTNEEYGNNQMIDNNLGSTYGINTGKYVSGTTTDSVWSMKLTPVSGTYAPTIRNDSTYNYTNYEVIPDTYTRVVSLDSATDFGDGSIGSNFTTSYAVYASATQPAGTYQGKVKFTLVHPSDAEAPLSPQPATAGCISYFANASNALGTMGCQSATDNASVTLLASNFSRDGYGFAGWSDKFDYTTNQNAKFYGPNETITVPEGTTVNGLALYAVWIKSEGSIQDQAKVASICSNLTAAPTDGTASLSSVSAFTDGRDNNTYAIAKLADGKCWMIENLRLADKDSGNNDIELSSTNTNNPSLPLTNNYAESTTSNHLSPSVNPTTTAWCTSYSSGSCVNQSMLNTDNFTNRATNPATNTNPIYSYGAYYNWYSATAGHGQYGSRYGLNYTAPGDICPTGWTLPTSGSADKDFSTLYTSLESTPANIRKYPNNFLYSGNVYGSSVSLIGLVGYYWSKSASSSGYAYSFDFDPDDDVNLSYSSSKIKGLNARCLAQ